MFLRHFVHILTGVCLKTYVSYQLPFTIILQAFSENYLTAGIGISIEDKGMFIIYGLGGGITGGGERNPSDIPQRGGLIFFDFVNFFQKIFYCF